MAFRRCVTRCDEEHQIKRFAYERTDRSIDGMRVAALSFQVRLPSGDKKASSESGLICDQTIVLTGSHKGFQIPLRRSRFKDPKTGKRLILLTNIVDTELDDRLKLTRR
jgi:hypothetical protein